MYSFFCKVGLLLAASIFISCDTAIDLKKEDPKIVLNFVGVSDIPWRGRVGVSLSILEAENIDMRPLVNDIDVRIYEDGNLIEPIATINEERYSYGDLLYGSKSFGPKAGSTYKIEASSERYDTVSSNYIHPFPVEVESFQVRRLGEAGPSENTEAIEVKVTFPDPPGENYYEVQLRGSFAEFYYLHSMPIKFAEFPYKTEALLDNVVFDDDLFDGQKKTMIFKGYIFLRGPYTLYEVELRSLSKEYYEYKKTSTLQSLTAPDPYTQPVIVENNITNGFGIFGGFSSAAKKGKLE